MRLTLATFAIAALTVANPNPVPAGVSSAIAPSRSPPPGCSPNYNGDFQIYPTNVTRKRDLEGRQDHAALYNTLKNGILMDQEGRTGYIAANGQFQFDSPPQAGAIFTAGFTVCQNGSLALGPTALWFRCLSGAGPTSNHDFYNLYNIDIGSVCIQSFIYTHPVNGGGGPLPVPGSLSTATTFYTGNVSSTPLPHSLPPSNSSSSSSSVSVSTSGGATGGAGQTTGRQTGGGGGPTNTGGAGGPTATGGGAGGAASSSSSSAFAAATNYANEMFGLAAGLLAFAVL